MDESDRRIVILGKTGAGKSSLANTIFGEKTFTIGHTANSGTSKCEAKTKSVNGRSIALIDTPGFFDTNKSEDERKTEIVRCITECAPGPHAFLIVLEVNKFTEQEQAVINKINQYFSEEAFRYATVVFTRGDQLPEGKTIDDFIHQNKPLRDLVKKCGGRCHVIDNKYWNQEHKYRSNQVQVEELLKTIDKMVRENNGRYYTNKMLQTVEEMRKQEEENIRQLPGNMSEEEIREQAKDTVFYKLLIKLTGVGVGMLLGAFFGVALSVKQVVTVLRKEISEGGTIQSSIGKAAAVIAATGKAFQGISEVYEAARAGEVKGGVTGYKASKEADTLFEAAKRAAKAVKNEAQF